MLNRDGVKCILRHVYFQSLMESGKQTMETFTGFGDDETEENTHWYVSPETPTPSDEDLAAEKAKQNNIETFYTRLSYDLMLACDRDQDGFINFSEYIMIRRGLIAWKQCAEVKMNRQGLKCALTITTPLKTPSQSEVDVVFKLGQEISHDRYAKSMSFPIFILVSDI